MKDSSKLTVSEWIFRILVIGGILFKLIILITYIMSK